MTKGVIEGLEVVQVDNQQCALPHRARAGCEGLPHPVCEQAAIGQVRERIVESQMVDFFFCRLAFGNVEMRSDVMGDDPVIPLDRGNGEPFRVDLAVLAPIPDFSLPCSGSGNRFPHFPIEIRVVAAGLQNARCLAHEFPGAIAGAFGECVVDTQDHAMRICDHHAFLRVEGGSGNAQLGFGLLAAGDIHKGHHCSSDFAIAIDRM